MANFMKNLSDIYAKKHWQDIAKAQKYTTKLLVDHGMGYKVHGTGVFIKLREHYFLLTAAHVIDLYDNLKIPLGSEQLLKPGGLIKYSNPEKTRESDPIDIAFMKLDDYTVSELINHYNFLSEKNILINHETKKNFYTFLGYPTTFSEYSILKSSFHSNVFFHSNYAESQKTYTQLNRDQTRNIIIKYNRKKTINTRKVEITMGPDLYGMSGCGLWFTNPLEISLSKSEPKLVAIMTDWPIKNRTVVIGTKMNVIIQAIVHEFNITV